MMTARWDEKDVPSLEGKVALVTGANSGLGLETSRMLARHGARVLLACRNPGKAAAAEEQVDAVATAGAGVVQLDLASLASISDCAEQVRDREAKLDLLINNAGLMAVDEAKTSDGFEMQIGVNHLGHFALTALLAPLLLATPGSRVVTVSSMGHRMGRLDIDDLFFEKRRYDRWRPYFQSKLANLLFTAELNRRLRKAKALTAALAAHPGATNTDLGHEGSGLTNAVLRPFAGFGQAAWTGALPIVRAATDPGAEGGQYYGPQWMLQGYPRVETPSHRARNLDDAQRLWTASERLTGVKFEVASP
jgi:NAD(P)-dependent dehydrogenase (short-subunit alcohol dehydrogenase family)